MKKYAALLVLSFLAVSRPALAVESQNVWDMAKSDKYDTKLGGMFGRGLLNISTSFVDILVHTVEGTQNGPAFVGTMSGLGSGLGCTALRLTSGALDVLTFWVPNFNGFPLSPSYSNCLEGTSMEKQAVQPVAPDWSKQQADFDAERAKLEKAARDAKDAMAAEREAFEKAQKQALDDLAKERARLAAEEKARQDKLQYVKK